MRPSFYLNKWVAIVVISFALWELASAIANERNFPHSWVVLGDLVPLLFSVGFWKTLGITIGISFTGFFVGTIIALIFGISISLWKSGELVTNGSINFLRSIPSVVFLPLLIASIGASIKTSVILTVFVVTFISVTFVVRGIKDTDPLLIEATRTLGLSTTNRIRYLYLPSTLSILGTGMRLSASRAFGTVVAAGLITGAPGLGSALGFANSSSNYPRVFSYVIVMGTVGVLIYSAFTLIENKFFHWRRTV
jgi:ABC-type nitrate/sulfonate/bicarbonate transport system permease component